MGIHFSTINPPAGGLEKMPLNQMNHSII